MRYKKCPDRLLSLYRRIRVPSAWRVRKISSHGSRLLQTASRWLLFRWPTGRWYISSHLRVWVSADKSEVNSCHRSFCCASSALQELLSYVWIPEGIRAWRRRFPHSDFRYDKDRGCEKDENKQHRTTAHNCMINRITS